MKPSSYNVSINNYRPEYKYKNQIFSEKKQRYKADSSADIEFKDLKGKLNILKNGFSSRVERKKERILLFCSKFTDQSKNNKNKPT